MQACDFDGAHAVGKPGDWVSELDGECGTIFCINHHDDLLNRNWMYSVYKPTEADLAAMNAGGVLRLGIMCDAHPVFQMGILTPETTAKVNPKPKWDLGDPI